MFACCITGDREEDEREREQRERRRQANNASHRRAYAAQSPEAKAERNSRRRERYAANAARRQHERRQRTVTQAIRIADSKNTSFPAFTFTFS